MEPFPWTLCSVLAENGEVQVKAATPVYTAAPTVLVTLAVLGLCCSSAGGEEHLRLGRAFRFGNTAWLGQVYGYLGGLTGTNQGGL